MNQDTALTIARAHLAERIDIEPILEKSAAGLCLYGIRDLSDYFVFSFHFPLETPCIGASKYIAISRKTGAIGFVGTIGE